VSEIPACQRVRKALTKQSIGNAFYQAQKIKGGKKENKKREAEVAKILSVQKQADLIPTDK
jgi:hypothetical protein